MASLPNSREPSTLPTMHRVVAIGLLALLVLSACSKPLPREAVEAACKRQIQASFWKEWEARVMSKKTWKLIPADARKKLRAEAKTRFEREFTSEQGKRVMADCTATYARLSNQAQLDCVVQANIDKLGKHAINNCLEL